MNKTLLTLVVASSFIVPAANATTDIDVLGVYTKATADWFKQEQDVQIQHRFNVGNQILRNSGLDIKVNLVGTKEYNYDSEKGMKKSQGQALDAITPGNTQSAVFSDIERVRREKGADMVAMFRNLDLDNTPDYDATERLISCGLAWVMPAYRWNRSANYAKSRMYSHSYMNECGDDTFIHELGHNFGLNHAHEQYNTPPHLSNGTEKDAYGYGEQRKFATTMAYGFLFGVRGRSYTFSNPNKQCEGVACGREDYANAVRAIGLTAPKIAAIYDSKVDPSNGGETQPEPTPTEENNVYEIASPVAIPDASGIDIPFDVDYHGEVSAPTIELDIAHEYIGDVSVQLFMPDNSYWTLKRANTNDRGTRYKVKFTLRDVDSQNVTGQWRLRVVDNYSRDVGVVNQAVLTFK
ncbi:zinc-dependent metalloprotease family protein [Vibrio atypicus]|uniref:zinc-dependent metalloprotease family protein n=1 Tax=Vibrio atypicus TaxID=558271 RepID=UPI003734DF20